MGFTDSKTLFTKISPVRLFFIASVPGAISMLASALYQVIDGILVGQILGELAFAALNLAMPFVIINFSLADLIGVGSAVPISVSLGKRETKRADNIFTCACDNHYLCGGQLPENLQKNKEQYVSEYFHVCPDCSPGICLSVHFPMGNLGSRACHLYGYVFCSVIAFWPFFRGKMELHFCRPEFSADMVKQIVSCGMPNFLNNIAGRVTSILLNFLLLRMGGAEAVSVYGILMYAEGFVQPLLYGMCDSLQPAVSYNLGVGNKKRIQAIEKCCYTASGVVSLLSAAVLTPCFWRWPAGQLCSLP